VKNMVVLTEADLDLLKWDFQGQESITYAICGASKCENEMRFLVREVFIPEDSDYTNREPCSARTSAHFVCMVYDKAYSKGLPVVVFMHTHPHRAFFSEKDENDTETHLKVLSDFNIRVYIRIVVGEDGLVADVHNLQEGRWERSPIDYILLYKRDGIDIIVPKNSDFRPDLMIDKELHNRTLQIGGGIEHALWMVNLLKLGVIGVGGVGNAFLHIYKHLCPKSLVLIDPDRLEISNANRFLGYHHGDEGKPKVEVARRELLAFNPEMEIEVYQERFPSENTIQAAKSCDIIVTAPDNHWLRIQASRLSALHLKPLFSGGAGIYADENGKPYRLSCSTWFQLAPPLGPCLKCLGITAKHPPHIEEQVNRVKRSYIKGFRDLGATPASIITLHTQCANLLVRNILYYLSNIGDEPVPLHLVYDEINHPSFEDLTPLFPRRVECSICGDKGFWAYGDYAPRIPSKQEMQEEQEEVEALTPLLYNHSEVTNA